MPERAVRAARLAWWLVYGLVLRLVSWAVVVVLAGTYFVGETVRGHQCKRRIARREAWSQGAQSRR